MIIQGGFIIGEQQSMVGDIRIENGIITEIKEKITPHEGEEIEDAKGCMVVPGGIDAHTHFDMSAAECKTADDFYTGTRAAIAGGTTTIIDFAEPDTGQPLQQGLDTWHKKAKEKSFCDYGFHMTVSGWDDTMEEQMRQIKEQGVTSFKAYTAYRDSIGVEEEQLEKILCAAKKINAIVCVHCEDDDILKVLQQKLKKEYPKDIKSHPLSRPNTVERLAVKQVVDMAHKINTPVYIVHLSTREGLQVVKEAREGQAKVYVETCPHYLLLNETKYNLPGFEGAKYVMSPPLRTQQDQKALWRGIRLNQIDTISTDHCAFFYKGQKEIGRNDFTRIPNGIPSVEQRMALIYHFGSVNEIPYEKIARLTASNPAKIFGLYPQKGVLQVGSDGDIVVMKKVAQYEISEDKQYQQVDYTPYEGVVVNQRIRTVYLRGKKMVADGVAVVQSPEGQFLCRR